MSGRIRACRLERHQHASIQAGLTMKLGLIPSTHSLLQSLPLKDEPLSEVCSSSDVIEFVEYYSVSYAEDELELFTEYVHRLGIVDIVGNDFTGQVAQSRSIPGLGGALKHAFAFDRMLTVMTGFDNVNALGLPYLLEACMDLNSAIELLVKGRLKLSAQALRSSLEAAVAHAYFSTTGLTYDTLENLQPKLPSMNDNKRGMLSHLAKFKVLNQPEVHKIASVYRRLSAAVHSQFQYLDMKFEDDSYENSVFRTIKDIEEVAILCLVVILNMQRMWIHGPVDIAPLFAAGAYEVS